MASACWLYTAAGLRPARLPTSPSDSICRAPCQSGLDDRIGLARRPTRGRRRGRGGRRTPRDAQQRGIAALDQRIPVGHDQDLCEHQTAPAAWRDPAWRSSSTVGSRRRSRPGPAAATAPSIQAFASAGASTAIAHDGSSSVRTRPTSPVRATPATPVIQMSRPTGCGRRQGVWRKRRWRRLVERCLNEFEKVG